MKILHENTSKCEDNYIIVECNNTVSLKNSVNKRIQEGYLPIGGIFLFFNNNFMQAMVKEKIKYGEKTNDK